MLLSELVKEVDRKMRRQHRVDDVLTEEFFYGKVLGIAVIRGDDKFGVRVKIEHPVGSPPITKVTVDDVVSQLVKGLE